MKQNDFFQNSNYVGFSITQGNEYRKKSWSIYKFTALANKIFQKIKFLFFLLKKIILI